MNIVIKLLTTLKLSVVKIRNYQSKNTLRNEERPSVSTKKTECDHKGLLTCTEQFSASNIVAEAASHSTT